MEDDSQTKAIFAIISNILHSLWPKKLVISYKTMENQIISTFLSFGPFEQYICLHDHEIEQ